ncbi:MAG TPA: hypothetical protein DCS93_09460 [Microscillaceae bacterium]|nr:hypothetical protein [Microscillaceae bacterium]
MTNNNHTLKIAQVISKLTLSIAALVFSIAAFIYSTSAVNAKEPAIVFPDKPVSGTYATGKYMMDMAMIPGSGSERAYYQILVWNTETGRSKFYYGNAKSGGSTKKAASSFNLPSNPLN